MAKKQTRDETLRILVTADQKQKFTKAANDAGLSLSSWGLTTMLHAVQP